MRGADDLLKLQDKTAIVTHPRTNLARVITSKLAEQGVDVALVGPNDKDSARFADSINNQREIRDSFGKCAFIPTDFNNKTDVEDAVARCAEALGAIDMLIDTSMTSLTAAFSSESALHHLDTMINVNLKVPLILTHRLMKFCRGRKKGRVIYVVPDLTRYGLENESLLGVTRTGFIHFAKVLAREIATDNVTVNCLAVGPTEEFLLARFPEAKSVQAAQEELQKILPGWRATDTNETANAICWLASSMSSAVTGQTISASALP